MLMRKRAHKTGLWALAAIVAFLCFAHAAPAANPVERVIRIYALTSANDFPERDPQDWRLLGSADGGHTWRLLDIRRGESFPERHQRREFAISNAAPFSAYRLAIDRVRSPAAANAVQLAEIQLLSGPGEPDPTPLFCDAITAQGENLPNETVRQAFDAQPDSKWLDFAADSRDTRSSWIQWQYSDHSGLALTNAAQLRSLGPRAAENFIVRLPGALAAAAKGGCCVLDPTGFVDALVAALPAEALPGRSVLLTGLSEWRGGRVAVSQAQLQFLDSPAALEPARIRIAQSLEGEPDFRWVEAEGLAQFFTESGGAASFELTDNERRLSVRLLHFHPGQTPPADGRRLRVRGLSGGVLNADGARVAGVLWVSGMDDITALAPSEALSSEAAGTNGDLAADTVLTQIEQIRRLRFPALSSEPHVRIRGVITDAGGGCIQDASGGMELWLRDGAAQQPQGLGAFVEVEGHVVLATGHGPTGRGPVIQADQIRFLGEGRLPDPARPPWSLLASGEMDAQWVEVDAVVRASDGSHLLLACASGQLVATVRAAPVAAVNNLLDATIRVRGFSIAATDSRGVMQGVGLVVPSLQFVNVLQPQADVESLPARSIGSLTLVRGPRERIHRVKVTGVLTGIDNDTYFVQDVTGGVSAIAKQDVVLNLPAGGWWTFWQTPRSNAAPTAATAFHVGDSVDVVGFPETRDLAPALTEAILSKAAPVPPLVPVKATAERLVRGELASTLVTLDGLAQGSEPLGNLMVFQIQSGLKTFRAVLPFEQGKEFHLAPGSRVRVTGVCEMEPVSHAELGLRPAEFTLRMRDASDVTLLEPPPWLSLRRALALVGTLALALLTAFVWIRLLHRQVAQRTRQLEQKIAEHEATEALLAGKTQLLEREIEDRKRVQAEVEKIHKQLLTTSRMAGMADVATNVLHNVGNVLNSVNVLAAAIAGHVEKSRVGGVSKLAELLSRHEGDLGEFVTQDAAGRCVPDHLGRLGAHLSDEQARLMDKIKALTESIQHIKEIVAMQQNYAKASGLRETASIAEVVEDALRMCSGALARHEIELERDYEDVPPFTLDRHKALQILFNLLDNAKHACWESGRKNKRIIVRIRRVANERARVDVIDNGAGVAPENIGRLFTQGFSTRMSGHGFGLHSSILAAQDMGGILSFCGNDPNPGAVFTLEIPLTPPPEPAEIDAAQMAPAH